MAAKFPKITEEGLAALRERIGVRIENTVEPWNYEASRDAIRHYAHGIGDDNRLWTDPDYAAQTKYGSIVALPSFLFSTNRIISGYSGGLSGVHAMWAGADWTWHKPVLRNDVISSEAYLKDLVEHQTKFAGRSFQQIYHVDFYNQQGDHVAGAASHGEQRQLEIAMTLATDPQVICWTNRWPAWALRRRNAWSRCSCA